MSNNPLHLLMQALASSLPTPTVQVTVYTEENNERRVLSEHSFDAFGGAIFAAPKLIGARKVLSLFEGKPLGAEHTLAECAQGIIALRVHSDPGIRLAAATVMILLDSLIQSTGTHEQDAFRRLTPERVLAAFEHMKERLTYERLSAIYDRAPADMFAEPQQGEVK